MFVSFILCKNYEWYEMKNNTDFNLRLEELKKEKGFDTYLETISHFIEYESDHEPEQIAKLLNKKIIENLEQEASEVGMFRNPEETVKLI
tara:strand:- start:58726 stop:58995 length:270 start_codon:yes stop_codon:yes gene_type:complete